MYLQPNITIRTDIIAAINDQIGLTPGLMTTAYNRNTSRLRSRWLADLRVEPPEAQNYYPLKWASEKQRRYVMMLLKQSGNLPYQRTHDLSKGWNVTMDSLDNGGVISVSNDAPEAQFVEGEYKQPMFDGTTGGVPWLDADLVNVQYLEEAEEVLSQTWYTIADEFAGIGS